MSKTLTFTVSAEEAGQRLDKLVAQRAKLGRRRAAEIFADGLVTAAGRRVTKGETARAGDEVSVELDVDDRPRPEPDAPLSVRLESPHVVVVSKPAGQASAPLRGESGTLCGALLGRYPEMSGVGHSPREPGLLHRLDTQTSGLLIAARSVEAFQRLLGALRSDGMTKRYFAIVASDGLDDSGVVDLPIAADRRNPRRVLVGDVARGRDRRGARMAVTEYRVVRRSSEWALLEVEVSRALRHQIRAHLAAIGHPLAGDAIYGGPSAPSLGERHALHACYVAWAGDEMVEGFAVEDPLPRELESLMAG